MSEGGARLVVTGRVQGVFYRGWTVETAQRLGLAGWVRNRRDGSVEIAAWGSAEALEALEAACHDGPPAARVDAVTRSALTEEPPADFSQRATA